MNINEIAIELDTTPKTLRRFMRSTLTADSLPGKGSRYEVDPTMLPALKEKFEEFTTRTHRTITLDDLND